VAALSGQLGYPITNAQSRRRLSVILKRRNHAVWTALDRSGEMAGWIHVFCAPKIVAESRAELGGLVVDARIRGRGVGRQLIREAERWARRCGCRALRVRMNVVRQDAHPCYRRLGYRLVKTQLIFHKHLGAVRANPGSRPRGPVSGATRQ
jgi:GNAT superfamily N-acetyltransferase